MGMRKYDTSKYILHLELLKNSTYFPNIAFFLSLKNNNMIKNWSDKKNLRCAE